MMLRDSVELANTRVKLGELLARYEQLQHDTGEETRVRRLTMMSLKRLINQLTEEIAVYKAHHMAAH